MAIKPTYIQCQANTDALKNSSVKVFATQVNVGDPLVQVGNRILSAATFTCEEISIDIRTRQAATLSVECIYKNAIGTLKIQQSVSGLIWTDISGATLTLVDSGTEAAQILRIASTGYGGNFLRAVFTAGGAGTGYLCINVV